MAPPGQQCYAAGREAKRRPGPFLSFGRLGVTEHRHAASLALSDVRLELGQPRGPASGPDDRGHRHRRALYRARGAAAACACHSLEFRADAALAAAAQDQGAALAGRRHCRDLGLRHHLRTWLDAVAPGRRNLRATCRAISTCLPARSRPCANRRNRPAPSTISRARSRASRTRSPRGQGRSPEGTAASAEPRRTGSRQAHPRRDQKARAAGLRDSAERARHGAAAARHRRHRHPVRHFHPAAARGSARPAGPPDGRRRHAAHHRHDE